MTIPGRTPWTVLVVDDNSHLRKSVRNLFDRDFEFEVVGEAEHGTEAIEKATSLKPYLIILDFAMPVMNGLEAALVLLDRLPEVKIILLTMYAEEYVEEPARRIGIHAVVPKHQAGTHLVSTARDLLNKTAA